MPEFDLGGCWPLWPQFGPDEMRYMCTRRWTADPGHNLPNAFLQPGSTKPMPCWQTCWAPLKGSGAAGHGAGGGASAAGGAFEPPPPIRLRSLAHETGEGLVQALSAAHASLIRDREYGNAATPLSTVLLL